MIRGTKLNISFAVVLVVVGVLGMASYINTQRLIESHGRMMHAHEVMEDLGDIMSLLTDAETGQRGFLLTGENRYLDPYNNASGKIAIRLAALTELVKDTPDQQASLRRIQGLANSKLDELKQTIQLRRQSGPEAAMPVILSDRGKMIMDDIRVLVAQMQSREQYLLRLRQKAADSTARWIMWTIAGGIPISLLALAIAAIILARSGRSSDIIGGPPEEVSSWQRIAARYAFSVAMVILASILRAWLLNLGPMPLFITYYPAVLLVAVVCGGGPGIATSIVSGLVALYYFIPPYGQFSAESPNDVVALAIFTVTNLSLCLVAERMRRFRWAEAFGLAKQQEAEELTRKNEELERQSEELSQQSEELAQQNEEMQSQSEEIQTLNTELTGREDTLRKLLEAARLHSAEESVLKDICAATKEIFGPLASAAVICERQGNELFIRAQAGMHETPKPWSIEGAFPGMVIREERTACLNDASLRPDMKLLQNTGAESFQSALSSPLCVNGEPFGAVTVYSHKKQEWTTEQFRLIEWFATQCGHILETLRLQDRLRETAEQNRILSNLLDRSEQPFGIGYTDGKLGYINAAFERLTGYSRKELEAIDWVNVLTPSQWRSMEKAKLDELHLTGQPARYEKEYVRKDGTRVPIELLVHLIKDNQGLPQYYYSFITDISERKRVEETLAGARVELEQRVAERTAELQQLTAQLRALAGELTLSEQRERSRLAKILHDHLQQLLVAAKFRLAILGKDSEELIKQAIKEVEELIDESIASSRSLTAELSPPILHEAGLNAGLSWLARRMTDRHGLLVDLELEDIEPLPDDLKILLYESVRELLFNTAKHAHTRSAIVNMRRVDGMLQLGVSDQGIGFDPSVMARAGESGRGFGLFSIRERLELFGGRFEIQSTKGQGSRISLIVPISQHVPVQLPSTEVAASPIIFDSKQNVASVPGRKIRVLLADDHAIVRQGVANLLGNEPDIEIVGEAADGQQAVELAAKLIPDVILMDMSMPKLNGVEATRAIINDYPHIRIIGLSMFEENDRAQALLDAGASSFMTKSGPSTELINAIRKFQVGEDQN
jgi:PAS domain S-box-containing protein